MIDNDKTQTQIDVRKLIVSYFLIAIIVLPALLYLVHIVIPQQKRNKCEEVMIKALPGVDTYMRDNPISNSSSLTLDRIVSDGILPLEMKCPAGGKLTVLIVAGKPMFDCDVHFTIKDKKRGLEIYWDDVVKHVILFLLIQLLFFRIAVLWRKKSYAGVCVTLAVVIFSGVALYYIVQGIYNRHDDCLNNLREIEKAATQYQRQSPISQPCLIDLDHVTSKGFIKSTNCPSGGIYRIFIKRGKCVGYCTIHSFIEDSCVFSLKEKFNP